MDGCFSSGGKRYISLPATGPVVQEAHLVTVDDGFGSSWPSFFTDDIGDHYALSDAEIQTAQNCAAYTPDPPVGGGTTAFGSVATLRQLPFWEPVPESAWEVRVRECRADALADLITELPGTLLRIRAGLDDGKRPHLASMLRAAFLWRSTDLLESVHLRHARRTMPELRDDDRPTRSPL